MCLLGKGEIIVFTQNGALWTIWSDPRIGPFLSPRQGDLAQIPGSEQAYDLVQNVDALMITLFKF